MLLVSPFKDKLAEINSQLSIEWQVENFCSLTEEPKYYYQSPSFLFGNSEFNLAVYPGGCVTNIKDTIKCISVHLKSKESAKVPNSNIIYTLGIKTSNESVKKVVTNEYSFDDKNNVACHKEFYKRSTFLLKKPDLSPNGHLTICATLKRSILPVTTQSSSNLCTKPVWEKKNFNLIKDLLYLNPKWLDEQCKMKEPPEAVSA